MLKIFSVVGVVVVVAVVVDDDVVVVVVVVVAVVVHQHHTYTRQQVHSTPVFLTIYVSAKDGLRVHWFFRIFAQLLFSTFLSRRVLKGSTTLNDCWYW